MTRNQPNQGQLHCTNAYAQRADELVPWTHDRLVIRVDRFGEYVAQDLIGQAYTRRDGTTDVYKDIWTSFARLSDARIIRHFRAENRQDLIGLHFADADNQGKSGALDIDQHGQDAVRAEANLTAALAWYRRLVSLGFQPLLTNSNGAGGYHLRLLLASCIDAARLHHFMKELCSDHLKYGLDKRPEWFPKQEDVRRCEKRLGNWLRLPGKHHSRLYWSEVWDGFRWLSGDDAIDYMLDLAGDDPDLIPEVAPAPSASPAASTPPGHASSQGFRGGNLSAFIASRLRYYPNLSLGQGRDDVGYRLACFLVRDLKLQDDIALLWLERWDANNRPPKGADRLRQIIQSAHVYGQSAYGSGRPSQETPRRDKRGHYTLHATGEMEI